MKLDIESRVRSGSENMISAFEKSGMSDQKKRLELESQLATAKAKEGLLAKAKNRYAQLYVAGDDEEQDLLLQHGRLLC
jgi:hypothetical protein